MTTPLRYSGAAQWVACHASHPLQQAHPEESPDESTLEGTCAHWVASHLVLTGEMVAEGTTDPNTGIVVTEEMCDAAIVWQALINSDDSLGATTRIEQYHNTGVIPNASGTPDAMQIWLGANYLRVSDFKYGYRYVSEYLSWQLMGYAFEGLASVGWIDRPDISVEFVVHQPRYGDGQPRRWITTSEKLWPHLQAMRDAAQRATMPNPVAVVGEQCHFCTGRHACETLRRTAYTAIATTGQLIDNELSPFELGKELDRLEYLQSALDNRISGLREQALSAIKKGHRVPNYEARRPTSRLQWIDPNAPEVLGAVLNVDLYNPPKPITPTQALDRGLITEHILRLYANRPPKQAALMRTDESAIKRLFGN